MLPSITMEEKKQKLKKKKDWQERNLKKNKVTWLQIYDCIVL